jgi:hypothetical protein
VSSFDPRDWFGPDPPHWTVILFCVLLFLVLSMIPWIVLGAPAPRYKAGWREAAIIGEWRMKWGNGWHKVRIGANGEWESTATFAPYTGYRTVGEWRLDGDTLTVEEGGEGDAYRGSWRARFKPGSWRGVTPFGNEVELER